MLLDAPSDCPLCPRLAGFRLEARAEHPDWFNAPVPSWGDPNGRLLVVGLAPGMKGANRTGRPFTGDYAGDLLYQILAEAGVTSGEYAADPDDGLQLHGALITNAVRCVPPQNKPVGAEINTCRQFLSSTIEGNPSVTTFLTLGGIAHQSLVRALGYKSSALPFGHAARHNLPNGRALFASYHCSRYNTNTNRLTPDMFRAVVFAAAEHARIGRWAEA